MRFWGEALDVLKVVMRFWGEGLSAVVLECLSSPVDPPEFGGGWMLEDYILFVCQGVCLYLRCGEMTVLVVMCLAVCLVM
jgi:hypothetical protein